MPHFKIDCSKEMLTSHSQSIVRDLASLFPMVQNIGSNVIEFEKASYFNKNMLDSSYQFSMP